jgi:hypothetical protein
MERTADWPRVFVDASAFRSFARAGCCTALKGYLGAKLRITLDVETELTRAPEAELRLFSMATNWPPGGAVQLSEESNEAAWRIIELSQDEGDHPRQNAGEVTTVFAARDDGEALIIVEDGLGKREAKKHDVKRMSTVQLVAEMVVLGHLTDEAGFKVLHECLSGRDEEQLSKIWRGTLKNSRAVNQPGS